MSENYIMTPAIVAKDCGYPKSVIDALKGLDENDPKAIRILKDARNGIYPDRVKVTMPTKTKNHPVRTNHSRRFA